MIGQTLGHYRIEAKLGEGGMGVVYRAHDTHLDRDVAIKVLSADAVSDADRKRRFVQEARTASALNHPNILHIYDIDQSGGIDFMAVEFVDGQTLDHLAGRAGLPVADVLNYAGQIAAALERAHEAGIVHRDIKPGNIMVTSGGLVKVLDFGLAKLTEPKPEMGDAADTQTVTPQTGVGVILGTVEYMAPEQAEGRHTDARSDIFSYGAVLYEILTGRRPFHEHSKLATLAAVLAKQPSPLHEVRKEVPAGLEAIINRCLQKEPERRFQSMSEVRQALDRLQHRRRRPAVSRRRLWTGMAFAMAAAALLAVIAITWPARHGGTRQQLIAVLPFRIAADDPAGRAWADGLRETLGRDLSWLNQSPAGARVLPPGDVRGDAASGPAETRKKLGAELALSGSVERTAAAVRLTLKLLDTSRLREVKRAEWVLPSNDITARQDLAQKVGAFLGLKLRAGAAELLASGTTRVPAAYDLYLQGNGYLARTDQASLDHAVESFQDALARDPSYGLAQVGLGDALCAKSALAVDKQWAEKASALAVNHSLPGAHLLLGKIYSSIGRTPEAVEEFRKALQFDPFSIAANIGLGQAYEASGQVRDAESTYKSLIAEWPSYIVPYSYLGSFYVKQGRYRDAETVLRKCTELAPENASSYQNLGAVYHLMGRTDDAAAMMRKSLGFKPTAGGYTNLGTLYFFEGRYSDAVPLMEKAAEMEPGNYIYWGNLGDAYRWAPEEKARAAEAYTHAIQLAEQQAAANPDDADLRSDLAIYYAKLPDAAKALAIIARARRLDPMNPEVLFKAALVYELMGRRNQAIDALDLALQEGYSLDEVRREPDLAELRKDPRYGRLEKGPAKRTH